jgi:hypothetical protein
MIFTGRPSAKLTQGQPTAHAFEQSTVSAYFTPLGTISKQHCAALLRLSNNAVLQTIGRFRH